MENHDERPKRKLKDISHLFLSSLENKERGEKFPSYFLAVIDPEHECSFGINNAIAKVLEARFQKIAIFDFHPLLERSILSNRNLNQPIVQCFLDSSSGEVNISKDWGANLRLIDFPWHSPSLLESVIRSLDGLIIKLSPTLASLRNTCRLLKGIAHFLREDPFIMCAEGKLSSQTFSEWDELFKRLVQRSITWIDGFEAILDKIKTHSGIGPADFLRPFFSPTPFFDNARLNENEIEAFFSLACRSDLEG